jgi:glycosidase
MKRTVFFAVLLLLFAGCASNSGGPQLDIIPLQFVFSGDEAAIRVQDLFYADDYSGLSFRSHPHLSTDMSDDGTELILKADRDFSGYTTLSFVFRNKKFDLPVKVVERKYITFSYDPGDEDVEKVCVFGNFNFWLRNSLWMIRNEDGVFTTTIPFEPGNYEYLFSVDGKEILDPSNPDSVPNGLGGYNSPLKVLPSFTGKRPFLTPAQYRSDKGLHLKYHILSNDYDGDMSHYDMVALLDNHRIPSSKIKIDGDMLKVKLPKNKLKNSRRFRIAWTSNVTTSNFAEIILEDEKPAANGGSFKWQDMIMYSLIVDRFYNANPANDDPIMHADLADRANFQGGDLQGVIQKLDEGYFNDLGVNTLWLLPYVKNTPHPFYETPPPHRMFSGYHGYWPISGREIDPHYGTSDDVHTMITSIHYHKLRILMDFVSNHVHQEHPYFRDHPEWFGQFILPDGRKNLRLFDEYRLTTWFDSFLPSFDYPNAPEAIDTMVADAIWWMKTYKIDGFRHDAVKHVPNVFWRALTRKIREEFPDKDVYQVGETFGDHSLISSYVNNGQLSAQFNFNLYWPARYAFAEDEESFGGLAAEMERVVDIYGQNHLMPNLMDSHDQPRYAAYLEHDLDWGENAAEAGWHRDIEIDDPVTYDKIKMYMTYLMTIPGPPVIYYGDEVGVTGAADPDNRRNMDWTWNSRQKKLKKYVSAMTALRSDHPALRYGDYSTVRADKQIYAYLRSDFNERILVVIHRKDFSGEIHIELPEELGIKGLECLNGAPQVSKDPLNQTIFYIQVAPYSGYVFKVIES